ncbi:NUDIX hydrolase [Butyrivibrio sp. AE3004]|uniref:NUDIX hydrolase n=1 Tax=Butyrivibrio sp. AE3004 TaxID=1506994 RepID=UPI0004946996|nr:CoA pyrophosphatase [Butyrivibrio sp. AE3004]
MNDLFNNLQKLNTLSKIPAKSSAVVIPLLEISGEFHILFEQRSKNLGFQPGEVCFPGGRIEANETPKAAAIRELCEELLLAPAKVTNNSNVNDSFTCNCDTLPRLEILTDLTPLMGPTGALVFPYVGLLKNYEMTFSPSEVEKVFTYPISFFKNNPAVRYNMQKKTIPPENFPYEKVTGGKNTYPWHTQHYDMWIYEKAEPVIWGFTGRLLHSFIELI